MYAELGDGELLALSGKHPEAFAVFYRRYAEDLLRYFARRTLDPETAAELLAETFAQAFASRSRFRDRGEGAAAWLYGIGKHQLSRFFRHGAVEAKARARLGLPVRELTPEDTDRIEEMIDLEGVRRAVAQAFARLSKEQREAMNLRVIDGRPYPEVARLLRCTEQAARARVSRGLSRLSELLEPHSAELRLVGGGTE